MANKVLVHTSVETIFSTDLKNCTYQFLSNRYFKALPFKQHQNYVSVMKTPSCANISMHGFNNNVNYMYFKDSLSLKSDYEVKYDMGLRISSGLASLKYALHKCITPEALL